MGGIFFSRNFVEMTTFLACNANAEILIFDQCRVRMRRIFHFSLGSKIVNFARAIARIRVRPFQLQSGEKYLMLNGRTFHFTPCNFAALASLVRGNTYF